MLDAFHVVKLAQTALDEVRRRRQQEQLARRGHAGDPLYQARRDLRRGLHTHTRRSWARAELAVTVGDLVETVPRLSPLAVVCTRETTDRSEGGPTVGADGLGPPWLCCPGSTTRPLRTYDDHYRPQALPLDLADC